jgi:hypothetical protein
MHTHTKTHTHACMYILHTHTHTHRCIPCVWGVAPHWDGLNWDSPSERPIAGELTSIDSISLDIDRLADDLPAHSGERERERERERVHGVPQPTGMCVCVCVCACER